ncbi:MAG TPA: hypothetical protein VFI02_12335 [Armatimonadota bacterium]|nr:hypothetical protein [Armatimonadota bacterium]
MNNQKNQIIVLCCLTAVVLGVGVFKVVGGNKPTPAHKDSTPAKVEQSSMAKSEEPTAAEDDAGPMVATQVNETSGYQARDPFTPQVVEPARQAERQQSTSSRPTPLVARDSRLPLPMITPLPTQPIDFSPSGRQANTQSDQPDPASVLRLTGVIEGSSNVAIIRGEEGARYIVREGQSIDGGYVVQSISRKGVSLRSGSKTIILALGSPPNKK